jgi:hypothetical protein
MISISIAESICFQDVVNTQQISKFGNNETGNAIKFEWFQAKNFSPEQSSF